jgi:hypothetical protein
MDCGSERNIDKLKFVEVFLRSPLLQSGIGTPGYPPIMESHVHWSMHLPVIGEDTFVAILPKADAEIACTFSNYCEAFGSADYYGKRDIFSDIHAYPISRFTDILMQHPIAQAYFIGATQGVHADLPENRLNPFLNEPEDVLVEGLELALLSGAVFSTMTEKERDEFFCNLEQDMREGKEGGFRTRAIFNYITNHKGCQNPKHKEKHEAKFLSRGITDDIMMTPRYKMYERALFYAVCRHIGDNNNILYEAEDRAELKKR